MTILGAFPPLSFLYNWLVGHGLQNVWVGLMAGVIAICVSLYNMHHAKETEVSDLRSVRLRGLDALTNQKSRGSLIPRLFFARLQALDELLDPVQSLFQVRVGVAVAQAHEPLGAEVDAGDDAHQAPPSASGCRRCWSPCRTSGCPQTCRRRPPASPRPGPCPPGAGRRSPGACGKISTTSLVSVSRAVTQARWTKEGTEVTQYWWNTWIRSISLASAMQ